MSSVLEKKILESLKEIHTKLDAIIAKIVTLEEKIIETEEPEPEDVKAYHEAEYRKRRIPKHFKKY